MADVVENSAEFYYERLSTSTNPGLILAQFFGNTFDRSVGRADIMVFNRLLKLYGRFTVYFSILDMSSMSDVNFDNIYPLLSYFCKKRLDQKYGVIVMENQNLDKVAQSVAKQIEKQKNAKFVIPEID